MEFHDIVQKGIKTIPKKEKCKKAKWLSEEALQIAVKRREAKGQGELPRKVHPKGAGELESVGARDAPRPRTKKQRKGMQWRRLGA